MTHNILACDVGLKRIGLATLTQGIILPLTPIIRSNRNQAAKELTNVLKERDIHILVVGMPSGGEAAHSDMQKRISHFIALLDFEGEMCFVNEDYTSSNALESLSYMKRQNRAKAQKDGRIDSLSACEILQRYMQSHNI
ncbi:Holliday junction resolvase RuvX [Helicobacter sp. MIT 21-1697]|uniref:Holliday junction resolvase RuvX n=1 Tax=Helicobacter sp. MIT 21-1697 TaxID=2993733 RepID=UPI00224AE751|nr:Holliday junction resolvase RuvX [Helicobacter sp. MIT 21-1697]MCX2717121.1 Holliday junction resolvase RuvX [Helicobacter sp. MIT 21-1697]